MTEKYEYKVVPAPKRAAKVKSVRGTPDRFAHALAQVMNDLGAEGWEYQRAETLPCEERHGISAKTTTFQNMLVFRRPLTQTEPLSVETEEDPAIKPPKAARISLLCKSKAPAPDDDHKAPQSPKEILTAASASLRADDAESYDEDEDDHADSEAPNGSDDDAPVTQPS